MKSTNGKSVYIFCYPDYASGGPEALHQLRYYMEQQGIDAWIVYMDKKTDETSITQRYLEYFPDQPKYIGEKDYIDSPDHLIIMPEAVTYKLFQYKKSKMAVWWLSVAAFDGRTVYLDDYSYKTSLGKAVCKLRYRLENLKRKYKTRYLYRSRNVANYCGSKYAYEFVTQMGQKADMLVEPISKCFLEAGGVFDMTESMLQRQKNVLYNPRKPSDLMSELLRRGTYNYLPISGYTPEQLVLLYRQNRLYVDFGGFPGPERLPKETVYNGCNILVGKRNAAANDFDVAIPEKYKLTGPTAEEAECIIEEMLEKYQEQFADFDSFRRKVDLLEENFKKQINELFSDYFC